MVRDAEEIPFRKVEGEDRFDSVAYCPVCRSGEIEITRTYTQQWNIIAYVDQQGFHSSVVPVCRDPMSGLEYNHGNPWHFVINMTCGNGHEFKLRFYTHKSLTWAEVDYPEKPGTLFPKQSPQ